MTRLIDADELHEIVNWSHEKPPYSKKKIHRLIDMTRTVDAEPVRHGKWCDLETFKRPWFRHHIFECSACGNTLDMDGVNAGRGDANYCPNCGAKMGERKEE